jgi:hypothetical protein
MSTLDLFGLFAGYVTIGSVALYLQFRSNVAALDKLAAAHERHTADLRMMIEVLQLMIMQGQETARPNRATHAEMEL